MKARNMTEEQVKSDVLLAAQPTKEFVTVEQVAALALYLLLGRRRLDHRRQPLDRRRLDRAVMSHALARATPAEGAAAEAARSINLALQGGGAHGAFTWGVLDELLDDDRHRDRGHLRRLGRRDQRRDAGRRARARRPGGGAEAARRFLARGQPRRRTCRRSTQR